MVLLDTPNWERGDPKNFENHYNKRIEFNGDCLKDVLQINHEMTMDEYKNLSYEAYEKAIIEYEADWHRHGRRTHRVDKRDIRTISSLKCKVMITCYHNHYGGENNHILESSRYSLMRNAIEHLKRLEWDVDGKVTTLYRIELIKKNIKKTRHRSLRSILRLKVDILKAKCELSKCL